MKYIRLFEDNQKSPKIGDYVVIKDFFIYNGYYRPLCNYFISHIGIITKIFAESVYLRYDNTPEEIKELLMKNPDVAYYTDDSICYAYIYADVDNLKYFGSKEEIELQMSMENYNL